MAHGVFGEEFGAPREAATDRISYNTSVQQSIEGRSSSRRELSMLVTSTRVAAIATVCLASCSAGDGTPSRFGSGTSEQNGTGAGGVAGATNSLIVVAPISDAAAALDPDATCSGEVHEGQRLPLDMYFLVDKSGSMGEQVQGGSKWQVVSGSLTAFLNDPGNADIGVGIGYFPPDNPPACTMGQPDCICIPIPLFPICFNNIGGSCNVPDFAKPSVPLSLPPNHSAVVSDIAAHNPGGGTPTRPALEGAMQYVNTWAQAHPDRKSVVVLATDGEPAGCTQNTPQDVATVAAAALSGPNHVQTFVIGVGKSLTNLNLIAHAGGSGDAFLVDTGGTVAKAFTDALNQIRGNAVPCDFKIPAQSSQGTVDPHLVNVYDTPQGTTQRVPVLMTHNGDPAACGTAGGWYYDDPAAPKTIKLCSSTCQALKGGKVEVEFGCKTIEATVN
jgi:Mg-chelatase subunit ChlD